MKTQVNFMKLHPDAVIPEHATPGSAGMDLVAISKEVDKYKEVVNFDTGLAVEIPEGYVGLIFPRSSIRKTSLRLSNAVGVIDSDYTGPIGFTFDITKSSGISYNVGDRIGQLVIVPYVEVIPREVKKLKTTSRGTGGFGSTGK